MRITPPALSLPKGFVHSPAREACAWPADGSACGAFKGLHGHGRTGVARGRAQANRDNDEGSLVIHTIHSAITTTGISRFMNTFQQRS